MSAVSLLGASAHSLSPTWAVKSFVNISRGGETKMETKGFDWDSLSIDASVDESSVGTISTHYSKTAHVLPKKSSMSKLKSKHGGSRKG
jgi:hypothetical protein